MDLFRRSRRLATNNDNVTAVGFIRDYDIQRRSSREKRGLLDNCDCTGVSCLFNMLIEELTPAYYEVKAAFDTVLRTFKAIGEWVEGVVTTIVNILKGSFNKVFRVYWCTPEWADDLADTAEDGWKKFKSLFRNRRDLNQVAYNYSPEYMQDNNASTELERLRRDGGLRSYKTVFLL